MNQIQTTNDADRRCNDKFILSDIEYESIFSIINSWDKQNFKTTIETIFWHNSFLLKNYKKQCNIIIGITETDDERFWVGNGVINKRFTKQ